jgi:hypothetical protein
LDVGPTGANEVYEHNWDTIGSPLCIRISTEM